MDFVHGISRTCKRVIEIFFLKLYRQQMFVDFVCDELYRLSILACFITTENYIEFWSSWRCVQILTRVSLQTINLSKLVGSDVQTHHHSLWNVDRFV